MIQKTRAAMGLSLFALAGWRLLFSASVFPMNDILISNVDGPPAAEVPISGKKHVLENGLSVIINRDDSSATTVFDILIKGGQKADPAGKEGLSWLTTRLSLEIAEEEKLMDLIEISSAFFTESFADFSSIRLTCLSVYLDKTLSILVSSLRDPIFSGLRIDAVKEAMFHFGKRERDDSVRLGHDMALSAFFGDTGCGAPPYGTEDSVKAITKKDIVNFYKTRFTGGNMVMAVTSDLAEESLLGMINKHFSKIVPGEPQPLSSAVPAVPENRARHLDKQTKQTLISRSFALPQLSRKNYALAFLLENLLGKGPASRLWPLRAEKQLAYNVSAKTAMMKDGGVLEAYFETAPEKAPSGRQSLLDVLDKTYQGGVSREDFASLKTAAKAEFLRWNELKNNRAVILAEFEAQELGYEFISVLFEVLDEISMDDLNLYIRQVLDPKNSVEIVLGPRVGQDR